MSRLPNRSDETQEDRFTRLAEQTEKAYPESWIPSDDDPLVVGTFLRFDVGETLYGRSHIAILRTRSTPIPAPTGMR